MQIVSLFPVRFGKTELPEMPKMTNLNVTLRKSIAADEQFVNDLTRRVMEKYVRETYKDEKDVVAYFEKNKFDLPTTSIIQYQGQDTGRLSVTQTPTHFSIDNIHVLPDFQGKGIGEAAIRQVFAQADALKIPVLLHVLQVNPSKKLYDRLGFEVYETKNHRFYMRREPQSA